MEYFFDYIDDVWGVNIITSIIVLVVTFLIYKSIIFFLNKSEEKMFTSKKSKTYFKLTKSVIRYISLIIGILLVLQINGVNVSSILAGVGIAGVVFGLAIQDWLKDVIRGSSILSDNYFSVGDIVKYKDIEAKVLVIGLKTTKLQDLKNSNVISIANRNIEEIEVVSNLIYVSVPMPYEVSVENAEKVVFEICKEINNNNNVNDCKYKSINELGESSVKYYIEINCNPLYRLQVKRDANRSILTVMSENGIHVPYNQIDVHNK
ncbi:MAG: mechanosensitive ion channel family protein [Clostridia bacterium]|nr:mechanosensitive ion channel family protein [Clostridia bacterium]